jgi:hypothetical protein
MTKQILPLSPCVSLSGLQSTDGTLAALPCVSSAVHTGCLTAHWARLQSNEAGYSGQSACFVPVTSRALASAVLIGDVPQSLDWNTLSRPRPYHSLSDIRSAIIPATAVAKPVKVAGT